MNRVDQKGKLYTERVRKSEVRVLISTLQGVVEGNMYLAPGQRIKDLLNSPQEGFLAVTDAAVERHGRTEPARADFIALNKQHIIWVVPLDEDIYPQEEEIPIRP